MYPTRENMYGDARKRGYRQVSVGDVLQSGHLEELRPKRRHFYNHGGEQSNVKTTKTKFKKINFALIVSDMNDQNETLQMSGIQAMRELLSGQNKISLEMLIRYNIVPTIIKFMQRSDHAMMQYEAVLSLTHIAASSFQEAQFVVKQKAVPYIMNLIHAPSTLVAEQAVWALYNISSYGSGMRDVIVKSALVVNLIPLLKPYKSASVLRSIVWLILNIVRIKDLKIYSIKALLPSLANMLCFSDQIIKEDVCWVFAHLTNGENVNIQAVLQSGAVRQLNALLLSEEPSIIKPAARCFRNITRGTDCHIEAVVNSGCLSKLVMLLQRSEFSILKEATRTVSNITSGNRMHIQAVLDSGIFQQIKNIFKNGDLYIQKEAVKAVTNITVFGAPEQIMCMIEKYKIMHSFAELVKVRDPIVVEVVQTGLLNMFSLVYKSGSTRDFFMMVQQIGGIKQLQTLQRHQYSEVKWLATRVIELYRNKQYEGARMRFDSYTRNAQRAKQNAQFAQNAHNAN